MNLSDPKVNQSGRQFFKTFNRFAVLLWRLGLGKWMNMFPQSLGRYMVLVHTGRTSGLRHLTPVNFTVLDGEIYCSAGFGAVSDWYKNIQSNPGIEVWLPDGWWAGYAEDVTSSEDSSTILRSLLIDSGFAASAFGADPRQLDDNALAKATANYRLIHITRTEPRTGEGGPGDLAYLWPLATIGLLFILLLQPRRR